MLSPGRRNPTLTLWAILLWACTAWASSPPSSQPAFQFTRNLWRTSDGLPEATVQALAETNDGLLWIGTTGGLATFGGFHLHTFAAPNLQALGGHSVFCLAKDRDGSLWAGTEGGGLLHIQGESVRVFSGREGLTDGFVRSVFQDAGGTLWVGTDDGLFRMQNNRLDRFDDRPSVPRIAVHSITADRSGNLWVGGSQLLRITPAGSVTRFDLPGEYSKSRVKRILQTSDGTVWVGTVGGLQRLVHGHFEPVPEIHTTVRSLLETNDGTLWIGTIGGGLWTRKSGALARVESPGLLPSDTVLTMLQDDDADIWIGTQAGMVRLSRTPVGIVPLPAGGDPDFETVSGDSEGNIWVAAQQLYALRRGQARITAFPRLGQVSVRNVFRERDGALWIGTDGSGAYRLDGHSVRHLSAPGDLTNNFIRAFLQTRDGAIWIATDEGVSRVLGKGSERYTEASGLVYFSTRCLLEDRRGGVWIGTDRGVSLWRDGKFQNNAVTAALAKEKVWSILQDRTGVLWFGTRDDGLFRYAEGKMQQITTAEGLPSNSIYQLLQDRGGTFWITGPDTIASLPEQPLDRAVLSPHQSLSVQVFTMPFGADGAQMYGGRQPAGFLAPDNTLWFPTSKGAAYIKTPQPRSVARSPRAIINAVEEDGRNTPTKDHLEIAADVTRLSVSFGAVFLRSPAGVRFRYRLEPLESAWNTTETEDTATYTNLTAGHYRFRVQAVDAAHPEALSETQLEFTKSPFFYQTWWFYALMLFALALAIWGVYRFRVGQIRTRFQAVLAERNRLAREMHDTVIQGCTGISALLEAIASRKDGKLDTELLDFAREQTRATIDEARHAVWDMRHDENEVNLFEAMSKLAEQTSREHGNSVTLNTAAASLKLGTSAAHEVLMTVREAVYNAIQHSGSDRIEMSAEEHEGEWTIRVADFGRGFEFARGQVQDGHFGMLGMQERMKRLGGRLEVRSTIGAGTVVLLRLRQTTCATRTRDMEERNAGAGDGKHH